MRVRHRSIHALLGLVLMVGWLTEAGCAWARPRASSACSTGQDPTHMVLEVDLDDTPVPERAAMLRQVVDIERRRLTDAGLDVRSIQADEPNRIHVELGSVDDLEWVTHLLVTPGRLEFREEIAQPDGTVGWVIAVRASRRWRREGAERSVLRKRGGGVRAEYYSSAGSVRVQ